MASYNYSQMQAVLGAKVIPREWHFPLTAKWFFGHFHSIKQNGASISQWGSIFSSFSLSLKSPNPFSNENKSLVLDGSIKTWPSAVIVFSPCAPGLVYYIGFSCSNNLLRTQKMGSREGGGVGWGVGGGNENKSLLLPQTQLSPTLPTAGHT